MYIYYKSTLTLARLGRLWFNQRMDDQDVAILISPLLSKTVFYVDNITRSCSVAFDNDTSHVLLKQDIVKDQFEPAVPVKIPKK
jgi:hypothetical protein